MIKWNKKKIFAWMGRIKENVEKFLSHTLETAIKMNYIDNA